MRKAGWSKADLPRLQGRKENQARLGHASITTTLNTYGHLSPSLGAQLDEHITFVHQEARAHVAAM